MCLFFYLKNREIFWLVIYSPHACHCQGWARLKASNLELNPGPPCGWQYPQILESICYLYSLHLQEVASKAEWPELEWNTPVWNVGIPTLSHSTRYPIFVLPKWKSYLVVPVSKSHPLSKYLFSKYDGECNAGKLSQRIISLTSVATFLPFL